jgi:hypothetical protein
MAKPKGTANKRKSAVVQRTILQAIGQGNTLANAAMQGGITYRTLCRWRTLSVAFSHAVEKAEAEAESLHVNAITSAGVSGNWQASAWWLERRRTPDWRKPSDRVEVTDHRRDAEAIAAEIGKADDPAIVAQIERDLLLSQEPTR